MRGPVRERRCRSAGTHATRDVSSVSEDDASPPSVMRLEHSVNRREVVGVAFEDRPVDRSRSRTSTAVSGRAALRRIRQASVRSQASGRWPHSRRVSRACRSCAAVARCACRRRAVGDRAFVFAHGAVSAPVIVSHRHVCHDACKSMSKVDVLLPDDDSRAVVHVRQTGDDPRDRRRRRTISARLSSPGQGRRRGGAYRRRQPP